MRIARNQTNITALVVSLVLAAGAVLFKITIYIYIECF